MAVIAVWKCDRDGSMFEDKKTADAHDKMLELAENITALIEGNIDGVSEASAEAIGLLLAKRSDDLVKACKGKPEVLLEKSEAVEASAKIASIA
ncbi:MAG: dsDNA-binding SOS-regulon protein [Flavobacteriales bacterium]|jgi:dsDNA-binding SOS-regulon protein